MLLLKMQLRKRRAATAKEVKVLLLGIDGAKGTAFH